MISCATSALGARAAAHAAAPPQSWLLQPQMQHLHAKQYPMFVCYIASLPLAGCRVIMRQRTAQLQLSSDQQMAVPAYKVTGPVTEVYMDSAALAYLVVRAANN